MSYNVRPLVISASLRENEALPADHPLRAFCTTLQDDHGPRYGIYWEDRSYQNVLSLFTSLEAKYTSAGREGSGLEISLDSPSEHIINIVTGEWLPIGDSFGLKFPVEFQSEAAFLSISFG